MRTQFDAGQADVAKKDSRYLFHCLFAKADAVHPAAIAAHPNEAEVGTSEWLAASRDDAIAFINNE